MKQEKTIELAALLLKNNSELKNKIGVFDLSNILEDVFKTIGIEITEKAEF